MHVFLFWENDSLNSRFFFAYLWFWICLSIIFLYLYADSKKNEERQRDTHFFCFVKDTMFFLYVFCINCEIKKENCLDMPKRKLSGKTNAKAKSTCKGVIQNEGFCWNIVFSFLLNMNIIACLKTVCKQWNQRKWTQCTISIDKDFTSFPHHPILQECLKNVINLTIFLSIPHSLSGGCAIKRVILLKNILKHSENAKFISLQGDFPGYDEIPNLSDMNGCICASCSLSELDLSKLQNCTTLKIQGIYDNRLQLPPNIQSLTVIDSYLLGFIDKSDSLQTLTTNQNTISFTETFPQLKKLYFFVYYPKVTPYSSCLFDMNCNLQKIVLWNKKTTTTHKRQDVSK